MKKQNQQPTAAGSGRVNGVVEWTRKEEGDYFLPAVTFALAVPRTFFCLFFLSLRCLRPPFSTLFARPSWNKKIR